MEYVSPVISPRPTSAIPENNEDNFQTIEDTLRAIADGAGTSNLSHEDLVRMCRKAQNEKENQQRKNRELQNILSGYFLAGRDERIVSFETSFILQDRLKVVLKEMKESVENFKDVQSYYAGIMKEVKTKNEEREEKVAELAESFKLFKSEIAKASVNSKTGQPFPSKVG